MAVSIVFALLACLFYCVWEYDLVKNDLIKSLCKDFVDLSPCLLLFFFFDIRCAVLLIGCVVANVLIDENDIMGALAFAFVYSFTAWLVYHTCEFNWIKLTVSLAIPLCLCGAILPFWKVDLLTKCLACVYAVGTLGSCLYTFSSCWNIGFLLLFFGDVSLIVSRLEFKECVKRTIRTLSNCVYFFGVTLIPLAFV